MKTIKEHITEILKEEPFLLEGINDGLINTSALSRKILPRINELTGKKTNLNAIIMAIKRLELEEVKNHKRTLQRSIKKLGDITVRSGLCDFTFKNSNSLEHNISKLSKEILENEFGFYTISKGIHETTIIINNDMHERLKKIMAKEEVLSFIDDLSSITVQLPKESSNVPGLYYFLLSQIAWKGISITEVISTTNEFTIILKNQHVGLAFETLMNLKN